MEKQVNRTTDDLISRADAIDAPEKFIKDCNPDHFVGHQKFIEYMDNAEIRSFGKWQFANGFNMGLTAIEVAIKKLPSAQQWYTGEPTEEGDYLVYKHGDDDDFNYFDVDTFYTHEGTVEYGTPLAYRGWHDDHDRVVAWMPLPEPPEVEE